MVPWLPEPGARDPGPERQHQIQVIHVRLTDLADAVREGRKRQSINAGGGKAKTREFL